MERLICLAIGYVCGLFQTGYIVGEMSHVDIRKKGSGNAGTTNALRVLGWKAGLLTFAGDVIKCVVAFLIVFFMYRGSDCRPLLTLYAGAGVTLGHNFPFYMNFKGGKGIAVMAGLVAVNSFWHLPLSLLMIGHTGFLSCSGDRDKIHICGIPCGLYRFSDRDDPHRTGRLAGYAGVILL